MLNPTFASFKTAKQSTFNNTVLCETNPNIQPKSFNELKHISNNCSNNLQFHNHKQQKVNFSNVEQCKKIPINFHLKKNYSQMNIMEPENAVQQEAEIKLTKPKINTKNYMTTKKNLVHLQRASREKQINRPSITGPTLLKNKSFIYGLNSETKQSHTSRPSHDISKGLTKFSDVSSVESFERRSQNSFNMSGSSNGDKDSFSCFNSSKFQDSINLKDSCNSSKLGERTLNFSRKTNRTIYKGNQQNIKFEPQSTYFGEISELCLMARELQSSFQSEPHNSKNISKKTQPIAQSKKTQNCKKNKDVYEPKKIHIDQFELLEEIGQGKYGKVYMARHKYTNFICALKTVSKEKIKEENIEEAFIREIKIQTYLNHPNIVKLYGFFEDKVNIYLIMECCLSGHLLKLIKQRKIFEQNDILEIVTNVFEAVSFLHCHGIIHRDLKPENIVIQNDVYKICDFGWAAYAKGDTRTTFCGTPLYVCPEVLKGNQYDEKADVWGLGVLTYQLAYGRVPFPIWSQSDMLKIVKDPVYFPTWTSVSEKMQNLIKSMLNKDPSKRLSLNEIMASSLIIQYVGTRVSLKSQMEALF